MPVPELLCYTVPEARVELARGCPRRILSPTDWLDHETPAESLCVRTTG